MATNRRAARQPFADHEAGANVELKQTKQQARAPQVAYVETTRPSTFRAVFWGTAGVLCVAVAVLCWGNGALITPEAITHQLYQVGWFIIASIWALAAVVAFKM